MGTYLDTFHLVSAPPAVDYRYGLFSVVEPRTAAIEGVTIDEHWRLGIKWQSQSCGEIKETAGPCIEVSRDPLSPDDQLCSVLEYDPFTLYAFNDDAIPGHTLAEHEANAIARLTKGEQYGAERHLWSAMTTAAGVATDATAYPIHIGLGLAEQSISQNYEAQGVLHMSRLTAMACAPFLKVEGGRMLTALGTPVVVGAGYNSGAPAATDLGKIIATGPLVMYRGDIDTRENAINKPINSVSIVAQRDYVIGWDCSALSVSVSLCNVCSPSVGG
jgi:hypothetical protein